MMEQGRLPKEIYIVAEYDGGTLRSYEKDGLCFFEPEDFPLTQETITQFRIWDDAFQTTYREDDPLASGFTSKDEENAWERLGVNLWQQIQRELSPEYEVFYQVYYNNKTLTLKNLSELPDDLSWL